MKERPYRMGLETSQLSGGNARIAQLEKKTTRRPEYGWHAIGLAPIAPQTIRPVAASTLVAAPTSPIKTMGRRRVIAAQQSKSGGRRSAPRNSGSNRLSNEKRDSALELNPTTDIPDIELFTEWDLCDEVQGAIAGMGITVPTPIQRLSVGPVLKRRDIIAKAETGTGKTLAFGAGMVSLIDPSRATVLGLVLCPTRELALQVHDVLKELGDTRGIKTCLIVGGDPPQPQVKALQDGAQLVIGTPGRVMDLYNQGFLSFPWTEFVVLDEADEMLEIGFIDDIKKILSYTPDERTTLLFSATFPPALLRLARDYTTNPLEIATAKGLATVSHISQNWMKVNEDDKCLALTRLIENSEPEDTFLVFGDRRTDVDQLIRRLERMPFPSKALHGGYDQASRTRVMNAFRAKEVKCLVATDVASRGLDVKHVSHVINYGVPRDVSIYTHRIGRTGRAGAKGAAITMVTLRDHGRWMELSGQMNWDVEMMELPERGGRGRNDGRRARRDSEPRTSNPESKPKREERGEPVRKSSRREEQPREEAAREERPTRSARASEPIRQERGEPVRKSSRRRDAEPGQAAAPQRDRDEQPRRSVRAQNSEAKPSNERGEPVRKSTRSRDQSEEPSRQQRDEPVRRSTRRRETEPTQDAAPKKDRDEQPRRSVRAQASEAKPSNERGEPVRKSTRSRSQREEPSRQQRDEPVRKSTRSRSQREEPVRQEREEQTAPALIRRERGEPVRMSSRRREEGKDQTQLAEQKPEREERPTRPRREQPKAAAPSVAEEVSQNSAPEQQPKAEKPKRAQRPKAAPKSEQTPKQQPSVGGFGDGI